MSEKYRTITGVFDAIIKPDELCRMYHSQEGLNLLYLDKQMTKAWTGMILLGRTITLKYIEVNFFCGSHHINDTYAYKQYNIPINMGITDEDEIYFRFKNDVTTEKTTIYINDKEFYFNAEQLTSQDGLFPSIDKFVLCLEIKRPNMKELEDIDIEQLKRETALKS